MLSSYINENFYNSQFLNPCFERRILKLQSLVLTHDLLPVLVAENTFRETFVWYGGGFILDKK